MQFCAIYDHPPVTSASSAITAPPPPSAPTSAPTAPPPSTMPPTMRQFCLLCGRMAKLSHPSDPSVGAAAFYSINSRLFPSLGDRSGGGEPEEVTIGKQKNIKKHQNYLNF